MRKIFLTVLLVLPFSLVNAQTLMTRYAHLGEVLVLPMATAPFPAPARDTGHTYRGKFFSREEHYADSSVLLFIPKNYRQGEKANLVVYFHGWYNNIDSACAQFKLIEQFSSAGTNAVFVFPEGPKNAPDSHGGIIEEPGAFKAFIDEVLSRLHATGKLQSSGAGDIVLAGHSGAYRVMSRIAAYGGVEEHLKEMYLFDGLYADTEKFMGWIDRGQGRFINIYTEDGGTKANSEAMMGLLRAKGTEFVSRNEAEMNDEDLRKYRLLFYYTPEGHNSVIASKEQFRRFLETGTLKKR